jgi:hypothetical protein
MPPAGPPGLTPDRVAEILVTLGADEPGRRGSGYRVTARTVLTAAHVVHGAASTQVRFDADRAGEWTADVTDVLELPEIDVALLTIAPRDAEQLAPSLFGRIGERDAVIQCSAVGFPLWKLREDPVRPRADGSPSRYRDSYHLTGWAAILSNRREGTLEITVGPEPDPDPAVSPWQGMSGAAVFCEGRIVGLISKHHRSDGLRRLAASRVDGWCERVSATQRRQLTDRLGLRQLEDVVRPAPGDLVQAAYIAQVSDIAPAQLMGRADELAELVEFCGGSEPYQWWQGDPWAGKTALAASFVLSPPAGVRVASFFITARLAGQSDSDAFTEAMIDQLAVIAGETVPQVTSAAAQDGLRRHLIDAAAARLGQRGERLVLVVDGLDEDTGAHPGSGRASIAKLLPPRPRDEVRVLVTSREQPPLPADVPGDHPLRRCRKRKLRALAMALDVEAQATDELLDRLHADGIDREIIALITAAGGGLTAAELAELTGRMHLDIEGQLSRVLGRSLYSRTSYATEDRVYLFAHETLRATADKILHADLGRFRDRIHVWAGLYRVQGWPESTPRYLFQRYGRMLAAAGDLVRFAAIAADRDRHDRMLQRFGADTVALTELGTAQELLLGQALPDLTALVLLAAERERLSNRTRAIPAGLPAVWARLGRTRYALDLARSLTDPQKRAEALARLADTLAAADPGSAAELAGEAENTAIAITDAKDRAKALVAIAAVLTSSYPERTARLAADAKQVAAAITGPGKASAVHDIDELVNDLDPVERAAREVRRAENSARGTLLVPDHAAELVEVSVALERVTRALADGDTDRAARAAADAQRAAGPISAPWMRVRIFSDVALAVAGCDPGRARELADEAERTARRSTLAEPRVLGVNQIDPAFFLLANLAAALAAVGRWEQAQEVALSVADRRWRAQALTDVAGALAATEPGEAARVATEAERVARGFGSRSEQAEGLVLMARALALAGLWDRSERAARAIAEPGYQARAFADIAGALAAAGEYDRAERIARGITAASDRVRAFADLIGAAAASDPGRAARLADEAEDTARAIPTPRAPEDPYRRTRALAQVARALAESQPQRAAQVAWDAAGRPSPTSYVLPLSLGSALPGFGPSPEVRAAIVAALAATGQWEQAERIARSESVALEAVAVARAAAGQWDRAGRIARAIDRPLCRVRALTDVARALAAAGEPHALERATRLLAEAGKVARGFADPRMQAEALVNISAALPTAAPSLVAAMDGDLRARVHRLLGQALTGDQWRAALPTVARVAPEAVIAVQDRLGA